MPPRTCTAFIYGVFVEIYKAAPSESFSRSSRLAARLIDFGGALRLRSSTTIKGSISREPVRYCAPLKNNLMIIAIGCLSPRCSWMRLLRRPILSICALALFFGGWRDKAPGVRCKITIADFTRPFATISHVDVPEIVSRPPVQRSKSARVYC